MVVEWLSWLLYKSGFINSNILETSKDRPNTPLSLKLLEQRVHELVGGPLNSASLPPQTTLWGAKSLNQEGLKSSLVSIDRASQPTQQNLKQSIFNLGRSSLALKPGFHIVITGLCGLSQSLEYLTIWIVGNHCQSLAVFQGQ